MSAELASAHVVAHTDDRVEVGRVGGEVAVEVMHERQSGRYIEAANESRYLEAKRVTHVHRVRLARAVRGKCPVLLIEVALPHECPPTAWCVVIDRERRAGCGTDANVCA